ncbi:hypothetical protein [Streptomyces sp. NPDC017940]
MDGQRTGQVAARLVESFVRSSKKPVLSGLCEAGSRIPADE